MYFRDLQIYKNMDENPVLWQILDLYAASKLALIVCNLRSDSTKWRFRKLYEIEKCIKLWFIHCGFPFFYINILFCDHFLSKHEKIKSQALSFSIGCKFLVFNVLGIYYYKFNSSLKDSSLIQVWKIHEPADVLFVFSGPLTMCRCSPILKSLTASLMIHFESSREKSARNTPKQLDAAAHLVTYLGKVFFNVFIVKIFLEHLWKQCHLYRGRWLIEMSFIY